MLRRVSLPALLVCGAYAVLLTACADGTTAPRPLTPSTRAASVAPVTRTHFEFSGTVDTDIYLTCIDEVTHWVGSFTVTVDVVRTPTGITSTRIRGNSDESTFVVTRADGTKYYMIGTGSTQRHDFDGPVSLVTLAEPKVFKSASGDVLVTNWALVIVLDQNGAPVTVHATGNCP